VTEAPARTDLLQGTLDVLILKTLALAPLHGWGISQRIQQLSRDVLQVNQGSLYPALYRSRRRLDPLGVGQLREQSPRPLLRADAGRPPAARRGDAELGALRRRGLAGARGERVMSRLRAAWAALFRRRALERQMDEEMRFHLEMEIQKLERRGLDRETARSRPCAASAESRNTRKSAATPGGSRPSRPCGRTSASPLRGLKRNPGYAAAALATLALGIGANVAVFSIVHGVFLQSLPYGGGERLVRLKRTSRRRTSRTSASRLRRSPTSHADAIPGGLAEYHSMWFILLREPEPERVQTGVVSANFFGVLGVEPILGRSFRRGEDAPGAEPVLLLSYDYWKRKHGGDSEGRRPNLQDERPDPHGRRSASADARPIPTRTTSGCRLRRAPSAGARPLPATETRACCNSSGARSRASSSRA
jgi:hypothetical protein